MRPSAFTPERIAIGVVASNAAADLVLTSLRGQGLAANRVGNQAAAGPGSTEAVVEAFRASALGAALERAAPARLAAELLAALRRGRILVWVALATPEDERAACTALLRHGCDTVQVHDLAPARAREAASSTRLMGERGWSARC